MHDRPARRVRRRRRRRHRLLHRHRGGRRRPPRRRRHPQLPARRDAAAASGTDEQDTAARATTSCPLEPRPARAHADDRRRGAARRLARGPRRLGDDDAVAEAERCLACAVCSDCGSCVRACPSGAIDFERARVDEEITVGAVIVATGHQEFDARRKLPLGFGRYANVITQSQLARLLSASGPTGGELLRPSDGAAPKQDLHAAVRRLARLHLDRQRALLGDLLPVRHAARLAAQAALPRGGDHDRLHRPADARQGPRGVLPAGAEPRRALRARPRRRDHRGARRAPAGALRGHRDRAQERGAVRPRRALRRARGVGRHRADRPGGRPADRPPPASSRSTTPSSPGRHPARRHVPVRHRPGAQEHPRLDRPGQGGRGAGHRRCSRAASC